MGSIRLTPYLLMAINRISGKCGSVVCCNEKNYLKRLICPWRENNENKNPNCICEQQVEKCQFAKYSCTATVPSLQKRPNQTWAIWKWPSETSAWLLPLISQHVCWSTPQSTADHKNDEYCVNTSTRISMCRTLRTLWVWHKPFSSRRARAGESDPEESSPSASWECWESGICHPRIWPGRSERRAGKPLLWSIYDSHADTWEAPTHRLADMICYFDKVQVLSTDHAWFFDLVYRCLHRLTW